MGERMTREVVMDKIRKLLRLGESPNENESAAAIAKAQALMEEYRIESHMLEEPPEAKEEVRTWEDPLHQRARSSWLGRLAVIISKANGCFVYKGGPHIWLVGTASNAEAARYMYGYCVKEIERLAKARGRGNGRIWMNNYRIGCVQGISHAINAEQERVYNDMRRVPDSRALVVVNRAIAKVQNEAVQAESYCRSKVPGLRNLKGARYCFNYDARAAGQRDGRRIYPGRRTAVAGPAPKQLPTSGEKE